eukprot:jgi/Psemu1/203500/e_gw1.323.25.1
MLHIDCVYGLLSRATPSIRASNRLHRSPFSSVSSMATNFSLRTTRSMPFLLRPSSSAETFKLKQSFSVETNRCDDIYSVSLSIPTMEMMEEVGALLAVLSQPSDVLFLDGDLGAGKTTFSRGFIKCKLGIMEDSSDCDGNDIDDNLTDSGVARVQQASLRITSPTYLLSNTYEYIESDDFSEENKEGEGKTIEIHHMDLYRLSGKSPRDFEPLGLGHVFSNCISLIEWPSRLQAFPELLPPEETLLKLDLRIPDRTSDERVLSIVSATESSWTDRLKYIVEEGMVDDLLLLSAPDEDDGQST